MAFCPLFRQSQAKAPVPAAKSQAGTIQYWSAATSPVRRTARLGARGAALT